MNPSLNNLEDENEVKQAFVYSCSKNEKLLLVMAKNYFRWEAADKLSEGRHSKIVTTSSLRSSHSYGSNKQIISENDSKISYVNPSKTNELNCACVSVKSCGLLKFKDIINVDLSKASVNDNQGCYLKIATYPKCKKPMCKSEVRKRKEYAFYFHNKKSFVENFEEVKEWISVYNELLISQSSSQVDKKKVLVLVNPFGGAGKAMDMYRKKIVPLFCEAGIRYETIKTEYAGHAKELMKKLKISELRGVVVVSGDGLIHEVVNGLMDREDCREAIELPIGVIPGGSGNALICSVLYQSGESYLHNIILTSSLFVIKNRVEPMDLVAVETCSGKMLYSILSVAWGIVADVDIESERYRNLGKARFTVGAIKRIINLRKYKGVLSFLPCSNETNSTNRSSKSNAIISPSSTKTSITAMPSSSTTTSNDHFDNHKNSYSNCDTPDLPINLSRFSAPMQEKESSNTRQSVNFIPRDSDPNIVDGKDDDNNEIRPNYIPNSITDPIPENWTKISADDFVSVIAVYQTHLAQDMRCMPSSRLKDGCIYLSVIKGNVSKLKMLHYFDAMEDGAIESISDPYCKLYKVKAFRIEPSNDIAAKGIMTVDGERVEYGPIQGWVIGGIARIMKAW